MDDFEPVFHMYSYIFYNALIPISVKNSKIHLNSKVYLITTPKVYNIDGVLMYVSVWVGYAFDTEVIVRMLIIKTENFSPFARKL